MEAEEAVITAPMVIVDGDTCDAPSNCQFVHTPFGGGNQGYATFNFNITIPDFYVIWGRAFGPLEHGPGLLDVGQDPRSEHRPADRCLLHRRPALRAHPHS
jgi:hypothetical protein